MNGGFLSAYELLAGGPQGLPHAIERTLWHLGFVDVQVIDNLDDQGPNLVAVRHREKWVFQCEWSPRGPIDRAGVDGLERARVRYRANKVVLVTNTTLNRAAEQRRLVLDTAGINIAVWDGPTLAAIWDQMPARVPGQYDLRDYQIAAADAVESDLAKKGRALLVLATGLGKTVIGGEIIRRQLRADPHASILVAAHVKVLVEQLERALWRHLDKTVLTRLVTGDVKPSSYDGVLIGTIKSVLGIVGSGWRPALVLIDETHHVGENGMFAQLLDICSDATQLGVTATPWRGDKFDITERFGPASYSMGIADGMTAGYLSAVDYRLFVDNLNWDVVHAESKHGYSIKELNRSLFLPQRDEEVLEQFRVAWREAPNPRVLVFCQTIEHAERMAALFAAADGAWRRASFLHSKLSRERRQALLNDFRLGRVPVITCVDVFNEGVDVPDVNIIGFLRVTHSRRIFVQQLGRGLRLSPWKTSLKVLDFVTDIRRVAATLELRRSLRPSETEDLRLKLPFGSRIEFNDEIAGNLFEDWIKDAASLEAASDDVRLQFPLKG